MERLDATRVAVELAGDAPIVASLGNPTFDLAALDRPQNFYLWNGMGMASSIGLGLALAQPNQRIVVLDGDGALLMNLSSLPTAHMAGVRNLVHVVWDNRGWEITGGQPAGSAFGVDLAAIARGSGFEHTATVADLESFRRVFREAIEDDAPWVIVARVAAGNASARPSKNCVALRDRFSTAVQARGG